MYILLLILIIILIVWKIIDGFSIIWLALIAGLSLGLFGYCYKEDSKLVGLAIMAVAVGIIVLGFVNRDVTIGAFVDSIPDMIMFWK